MSDKELADRIVALVGFDDYGSYGIRDKTGGFSTTNALQYVHSWMAAGAMMEKCYDYHFNIFAGGVSLAPNNSWGLPNEDNRTYADDEDGESLPRAINEACVGALEAEK